ncbi:ATP-dependent helicase, partial [Candidatus Saccharibacteria bacterium]|nr:ATP-dependent helicase [Candidatus Saccharibacteria bacterium]
MGLNANQKRAVEYLDGPLLVLAGPGTGKTQLLSEKVAYLLKKTDINPENILCLTFTDSGMMNMKERLKTIIGPEGAKVNVSTYHVFGTSILAQYKNYSENYDRQLDSAIDEVTQFKIVKEMRDKLPGTDILRGDNVKLIISVISSAKSAGLSSDDLKKVAETNLEDSEILSEAISPLLLNVVPRKYQESHDKAYQPIFEILKEYVDAKPILPTVERSIGELARSLKSAMTEAESLQKITPLTDWRNDHFEKDNRGHYRLKDRVANKKLLSVSKVMADYNKYLKDNGLYDFDDMIQEAVRVLSEDEGFRLTLSERYEYIMLDEFQDTNPSQFMIIKKLTDYEKPSIMAVGDDDQAIYEFQGALSTNLTDFQKHYNAEVIPLVENYRSTQEILDFSHEIIKQAPDRFADKELIAHKEAPRKSQIYRYEFRSSDMEFAFVADKIAELIESGVPQDEIAVISYMRKYFTPLLPYLKSHPEINIAYEKQNDLFEDDKIHQILTIAKYVYEIANERNENTSIVEILGYPFFILPMLEVIKIVSNARKDRKSVFDYLIESDNLEIRQVAEFLANLVAASFTEPLEILLDYVIGTSELKGFCSPFLKYYSGKDEYSTYTLYDNLAALRGKLRKHYGDKSLKLPELVEMIRDYESAEMSLNTTSPYRDAENAVQVLTAHKAKGLEFSYVFILSADHAAWGKEKGNNTTLSLPRNLMQIRHTGTTDGEKLRILYVALTRAKQGLYITNSLYDFNGKSPERLEYLSEYTEGDKVISPFLPTREVKCCYEQSALKISEKNIKNWLSSYLVTTPDMQAIYKQVVSNYRMSATSLTTFVDVAYGGPEEFFKREILRVPPEPEDESLAFGNIVHKTFEEVTNKNLNDEEAIQFYLQELDKRSFESSIMQKLREKGPVDLAVSLKEFGPIIRQGKAEVNFYPDKLVVEGVPITGKIDHINVDEDKKTIEVYDFKTAGYHKEKWQSHVSLFKYSLQLEFYKLLLNNSPEYKKYKVEKAHILFVVPDKKDGYVYDKVYEYDDKAEKELIKLMKVIYRLVTTLDFMKDPEIFVSGDRSLGVKDIKKFIELLLAK